MKSILNRVDIFIKRYHACRLSRLNENGGDRDAGTEAGKEIRKMA